MDKLPAPHHFQGVNGQQFPFDKNASQFTSDHKLLRSQLSRALSALGLSETHTTNPLHFLVYFENRSTSYEQYEKTKGNYTDNSRAPVPATIYWELEDVIAAIVNTYQKNKPADRNTLCNLVLDQLASENANRITQEQLEDSSFIKISDKALSTLLSDPKTVYFLKSNSLQRRRASSQISNHSGSFRAPPRK